MTQKLSVGIPQPAGRRVAVARAIIATVFLVMLSMVAGASSPATAATFPIVSGNSSNGVLGQPYSYSYVITGDPTPTAAITEGGLPPGLELSEQGVISGVPTTVGTYFFTITVSNGMPPWDNDHRQQRIIIAPPPTVAPTLTGTPQSGLVNEAYDFAYSVTGSPVATVTLAGGTFPPGLELSPTGVVSGVPSLPGTFSFSLSASNETLPDAVLDSVIQVDAPPSLSGIPGAGQVGVGYTFAYAVSGTPTPIEAVTAGSLPPGLAISDVGVLSGTPTEPGTYTFSVTASNGIGLSVTVTSTMTIGLQPTIAGVEQDAVVGTPFSYTLAISGSPAPTVTLAGGALPSGLTLAADGRVSGVPSAPGTYTAQLTASNGFGPDAAYELVITVTTASVPVTPTPTAGTGGGATAPTGPVASTSSSRLATTGFESSPFAVVLAVGLGLLGAQLMFLASRRRRSL